MSKPVFVYTTYIETSAEKLWQALTDGAFTERYWFGHRVASDWTPGAPFRFTHTDRPTIEGTVLVCDPPRKLSYTWNPCSEEARREGLSRVTFDIEPQGTVVKLTVIHDELHEGGKTFSGISLGWPMVLSNLKSLLETGHLIAIDAPQPQQTASA